LAVGFSVDGETKLKGFVEEEEPKSEDPVADAPFVPNREAVLLLLSENERAACADGPFVPNSEAVLLLVSESEKGAGEDPAKLPVTGFGCWFTLSELESEDCGLEDSLLEAKLATLFAASSQDCGAGLLAGDS
jgi:hypothetical protein